MASEETRMRQLWAPWRMAYVEVNKAAPQDADCFICRGLAQDSDRDNLIAWRLRHSAVILNRFPYNNGHLLIAPNRHVASLRDLNDDETLEMHKTIARLTEILDDLMQPQGYNIGVNLGKAAGAGLPGHVHWHIVPRWNGDTNFMTICGDVRVIIQSLETFFDLLHSRCVT